MGAVVADVVITKLQADVDQYIAGINSAQSNFSQKLAVMQADAQKLGTVMNLAGNSKPFTPLIQNAPKAAAAVKGVNTQLAYLPAQLNDIAVQLAGGQSPLLIMVQQGTQITQAFSGVGAGGAVKALGGAFASLVNPVNLAVFALIAATGYAVQYFSTLVEGGDKSEAQLKKEAELIADVAAKWGDLLPAVKDYQDAKEKALGESNAREATQLVIAGFFKNAKQEIKGLNVDIVDLQARLEALGADPTKLNTIITAFAALQKAIAENRDSTREVTALQAALNDVYRELPIDSLKKFMSGVDGIADSWERAAQKADEARKQFVRATEPDIFDPRDPRFQGPTGPLPSNAPTPGERPSYEDVGDTIAEAMIKKFESFIPNAKFDVNAFRVGFGSDTTTAADGSVSKVTRETTTTLLDAQRDLSRRIQEFQDGIVAAIGGDKFNSFTQEQQAALTSVAYNYGSLPDRIVKAILAGGSPEDIAKAIAALQTDNGGINKNRRLQEASAFASGTGFSAKEKTPQDIFNGKLEDVQKRIETLNAEVEARNKLNPLVKDYGYQVEKARVEAELLNEAQQAGLTITPGLSAQISEYATNLAKATAARAQLTEAQKYAADALKAGSEFGKDVLGGLIRDLRDGKDAGDALADALEKVADKLLDVALNSAFGLGQGGTGGGGPLSFIGQLLSGLFKAAGGPVRKGQPYIVGEKRAELFIPDSNGRIMPSVPNIQTPSHWQGAGGGGSLTVQSTVGVIDGQLVPIMSRVAGVVAGQQVRQASKASPSRINSYQTRGT